MEKIKCMEERKMEVIINKNKVKEMWDCVENGREEHQRHVGVFSWPPRTYTCSFCKREFRSAQALGGHMNVHRRDRARLRHLPSTGEYGHGHGQLSFLNLNLEPNPNLNVNTTTSPNFSSPSISTSSLSSPSIRYTLDHPPFTSRLPSLFAPPLSSTPLASISEMRTWGESKMSHTTPKAPDFGKIRATKRIVELEKLGTNECGGNGSLMKKAEFVRLELETGLLGQAHEDLDLELRLGYT